MTEAKKKTYQDFILPPSVVSKIDVSRLVNEVELIDNELTAAKVRSKLGSKAYAEPVMSEQLRDFLSDNKLTLEDGHERTTLIKQLRELKSKVPIIHMTFATTADHKSLSQLADWVRTSVHPQAVIAVGLQPALVGGVYIRTPNHVHDFTIRGRLEAQRHQLVEDLEALRGGK